MRSVGPQGSGVFTRREKGEGEGVKGRERREAEGGVERENREGSPRFISCLEKPREVREVLKQFKMSSVFVSECGGDEDSPS